MGKVEKTPEAKEYQLSKDEKATFQLLHQRRVMLEKQIQLQAQAAHLQAAAIDKENDAIIASISTRIGVSILGGHLDLESGKVTIGGEPPTPTEAPIPHLQVVPQEDAAPAQE